jgi:hypothetical protein
MGGTFRLHPPPGYDGVTPVPLLLMLHSTNGYVDFRYLTADQPSAQSYLTVETRAPSTSVGSFESVPPAQFTALFTQVLETTCVDMNQLFGVGNGSGARFMMRWLGGGKNLPVVPSFRAAALVGTYQRVPTPPPLPILFLHSLFSSNSRGVAQDEDGMKALALLMTANKCTSDSSVPFATAGCEKSPTIDPGCVDLDECAAPLRFCHHDSPDSSGDPWPCFATSAIYEFFAGYRGY